MLLLHSFLLLASVCSGAIPRPDFEPFNPNPNSNPNSPRYDLLRRFAPGMQLQVDHRYAFSTRMTDRMSLLVVGRVGHLQNNAANGLDFVGNEYRLGVSPLPDGRLEHNSPTVVENPQPWRLGQGPSTPYIFRGEVMPYTEDEIRSKGEEINRAHRFRFDAETHNPATFVDELFERIQKPGVAKRSQIGNNILSVNPETPASRFLTLTSPNNGEIRLQEHHHYALSIHLEDYWTHRLWVGYVVQREINPDYGLKFVATGYYLEASPQHGSPTHVRYVPGRDLTENTVKQYTFKGEVMPYSPLMIRPIAEEINRVHNSQYNAATHNPNTFVDELFFRIKKP